MHSLVNMGYHMDRLFSYSSKIFEIHFNASKTDNLNIENYEKFNYLMKIISYWEFQKKI